MGTFDKSFIMHIHIRKNTVGTNVCKVKVPSRTEGILTTDIDIS